MTNEIWISYDPDLYTCPRCQEKDIELIKLYTTYQRREVKDIDISDGKMIFDSKPNAKKEYVSNSYLECITCSKQWAHKVCRELRTVLKWGDGLE